MKKVIEEAVFLSPNAQQLLPQIDFADTFSTTNHVDDIETITRLVFETTPVWVEALFSIRNKIVQFFGLKTERPADYNENFKVGGYVYFFKIYSLSENEVILGADDKHLNFRAVVSKTKDPRYNIKLSTLVQFNNKMGRVYMKIIKPFHRMVLMHMLKQAYRE